MIVTVASRFISTRGDPRFVDVIGDLEKIQRTEWHQASRAPRLLVVSVMFVVAVRFHFLH